MSKSHPRWRLAKKILTWLFFIAVIVLLVVYAKKVDWEEVWKVIRDYNRVALLSAVGLVVVSYLIYGCYDLLARFYCGHKLAKRQVMLVSFICYAFNLTLSTWVGGAIVCTLVWGCPVALLRGFSRSVLPPTGWAIFYWQGLSLPQAWWSCRITGMSIKLRCVFSALAY